MEVSRLVKKLEKELDLWGNSDSAAIFEASKRVEKLENELEIFRNSYRNKLQKDLGKDFSIEGLLDESNSLHIPIERYFFPIKYKDKWFGIARPFAKKKTAVLCSVKKNVFNHASEIMKKYGYKVTNTICYPTSYTDLSCLAISSFLEDS